VSTLPANVTGSTVRADRPPLVRSDHDDELETLRSPFLVPDRRVMGRRSVLTFGGERSMPQVRQIGISHGRR
jgi:hypothetical protein